MTRRITRRGQEARAALIEEGPTALALGRPAIATILRRFYTAFVARVVTYVRDANQGAAADLEQRAWLFVALLEGASVLGVIADHANHDEALRSALRRILVG